MNVEPVTDTSISIDIFLTQNHKNETIYPTS